MEECCAPPAQRYAVLAARLRSRTERYERQMGTRGEGEGGGEDEEQDRIWQHERGVLHGELAWDMNMSVDDCRCTSELLEHAPLPVTM